MVPEFPKLNFQISKTLETITFLSFGPSVQKVLEGRRVVRPRNLKVRKWLDEDWDWNETKFLFKFIKVSYLNFSYGILNSVFFRFQMSFMVLSSEINNYHKMGILCKILVDLILQGKSLSNQVSHLDNLVRFQNEMLGFCWD